MLSPKRVDDVWKHGIHLVRGDWLGVCSVTMLLLSPIFQIYGVMNCDILNPLCLHVWTYRPMKIILYFFSGDQQREETGEEIPHNISFTWTVRATERKLILHSNRSCVEWSFPLHFIDHLTQLRAYPSCQCQFQLEPFMNYVTNTMASFILLFYL